MRFSMPRFHDDQRYDMFGACKENVPYDNFRARKRGGARLATGLKTKEYKLWNQTWQG